MKNRTLAAIVCNSLVFVTVVAGNESAGQRDRKIVISTMARERAGTRLQFIHGDCELNDTETTMTCHFQEVLIMLIDAQTCGIYANGFEKIFEKQDVNTWRSDSKTPGLCGATDLTILHSRGVTRWTMEREWRIPDNPQDPSCKSLFRETHELYTFDSRQRLPPCRWIVPLRQ